MKKSNDPAGWSNEELKGWFNSGTWKQGWEVVPDASVNQREFAVRYHKNPLRWEKAFTYLKETGLAGLEPGRYELEGDSLVILISEYMPKMEEDVPFEAHRIYADIQYVISGEEKIGVIPMAGTRETIPYDPEKDIVFFTSDAENYRIANQERFFIFFPDDAHRPGVISGEEGMVKKVVVKVMLD